MMPAMAEAVRGGCELASQNLHWFEEMEARGAVRRDAALGAHAQFIEEICA